MFLCFTMLLGTTYAWFTDSVTSDVNQIVAGNLDVELDYYNAAVGDYKTVQGATDLFGDAKWEPGHAEVVYLRLSNKGSLAFTYSTAVSVIGEVIGKTKAAADGSKQDIRLSQYLKFAVVNNVNYKDSTKFADRADAIAKAEAVGAAPLWNVDRETYNSALCFKGQMLPGDVDKYFAIVVWMPSTVGNEANHDGLHVPSIDLGIGVFATQYTYENDSFGSDYDASAVDEIPAHGVGRHPVINDIAGYELEARDPSNNSKVASASVPASAVDPNATEIILEATETNAPDGLVVTDGYSTKTYEVTVSGLKDNNDIPVMVYLRMEPGLDPAQVVLYHNSIKIDSTYNPHTGYVKFDSTNFSPFTIAFNADSEYVETSPVGNTPRAEVSEFDINNTPGYSGTTETWQTYDIFGPTEDLECKLEAAYLFACEQTPEQANADPHANWYCDFFVKLDAPLAKDQIFLGGNYGDFGWVGFHNGDVTLEANTYVPLISSMFVNPWTYKDVANYVGQFICGVGDVNDALAGATFTVELRLVDPSKVNLDGNGNGDPWWFNLPKTNEAGETVYKVVNSTTHTFATVVNNAQELQDAINNGSTNIELGGDIDLGSGGIVIP